MLKGEQLYLRALEPQDVDTLYNWENDPAIWRVSNTLAPFSRHDIEQFVMMGHDLKAHGQCRFMICRNDSEGAIGAIDLFDYDERNQRAGVAILIANEADRGNGYATEALKLLVEYCFDHLLLNQLYCSVGDANEPSNRLFEAQGFELVGTKKQWMKTANGWEDERMYQLLK